MVEKKVDDLRMELVEVREAIDMAEAVLEYQEDANIRQQLHNLKQQEAVLRARIMEWSV
ncbi:hypothetical protein [Clostridium peptidivorans]|uniref:hypothetical protein n=1 Tax=Clostridium peptidivorans TaxID=100174 RepID=UPI0015C91643|nr:hypothetical protein [Clostridium peptidivorans]